MAVQLASSRGQDSPHSPSQGADQSHTLTPKELSTLFDSKSTQAITITEVQEQPPQRRGSRPMSAAAAGKDASTASV